MHQKTSLSCGKIICLNAFSPFLFLNKIFYRSQKSMWRFQHNSEKVDWQYWTVSAMLYEKKWRVTRPTTSQWDLSNFSSHFLSSLENLHTAFPSAPVSAEDTAALLGLGKAVSIHHKDGSLRSENTSRLWGSQTSRGKKIAGRERSLVYLQHRLGE